MSESLFEILAAIIIGIIGPLITLFVGYIIDQKKYPIASKERLNKLIKTAWKCRFIQEDPTGNSERVVTEFNISLHNKGRKIYGEAEIGINNIGKTTIKFRNGIFDGYTLKIEYMNEDRAIFQHGTVILEMDPMSKRLDGHFIGYSPGFKKIISGNAEMKA